MILRDFVLILKLSTIHKPSFPSNATSFTLESPLSQQKIECAYDIGSQSDGPYDG